MNRVNYASAPFIWITTILKYPFQENYWKVFKDATTTFVEIYSNCIYTSNFSILDFLKRLLFRLYQQANLNCHTKVNWTMHRTIQHFSLWIYRSFALVRGRNPEFFPVYFHTCNILGIFQYLEFLSRFFSFPSGSSNVRVSYLSIMGLGPRPNPADIFFPVQWSFIRFL